MDENQTRVLFNPQKLKESEVPAEDEFQAKKTQTLNRRSRVAGLRTHMDPRPGTWRSRLRWSAGPLRASRRDPAVRT